MNLLSPEPFWPIRGGLPQTYPSLAGNASCEVAVLGAGISGALAAWHLAEAGVDVVVLDRREVAHGSTAGSTSLLQYEIDEPLHRLARRYGPVQAAYAYRRSLAAVTGLGKLVRRLRIDCEFVDRTSLLLASNDAHVPRLRREYEARARAGFDVEWWDRRRIIRGSTLPQPAAILSHGAGQLDAYRLTYGLLAAARRRGARIYDRTTVTGTRFHPRRVELRTAEGHCLRARHLVVATGYEVDAFLKIRMTELHSTFALISEPVAAFPGWPAARCLIWETADPYVYLRTTEDGRVLIGGYDEPFRDPVARDRLLGPKTARLQRRFRELLPRIPLQVAYAWAGTFAKTADGLPFIGRHPGVPHTWFALGYGGNGITYSFIAAELIRDQILGVARAEDDIFGFARSPGSPPGRLARRLKNVRF
ncbi:MAG: FAD-binding oxidoreductase [Opitutaceae bacterium]|nr:FAD-binding oxidoreductase [Opitutaceae bacterium]